MADIAVGVTAETLRVADTGQVEYVRDETVTIHDGGRITLGPGALRISDGGRVALTPGGALHISDVVAVTLQGGGAADLTRLVTAEDARLRDAGGGRTALSGAGALRISDTITAEILSPGIPVGGTTWRVEMQFSVGVWTDVTRDVAVAETFRWLRGSTANGPTDRMAGPGLFEFSLRNDAKNSGGLQGYYSLGHTNCRAGFTYGIPVRLRATLATTTYPLWRGRLKTIDPDPGRHFNQRTHCTAQDAVGDLVDAHVIGIPPQVNQTEDALLTALLTAVAAEAQPPAVDFDPGLDVAPYAFDNLGSGAGAWAAMADVVVSAFGWCYGLGDGTLVYENRHVRALKASVHTFNGDTDGVTLRVPNSLDRVYNRVRIAYHPKSIDPAPTTVLFAAPSASQVVQSQTVVLWGTYRDPTNTLKLIGGVEVIDGPLAAGDFIAGTNADGSGTDLHAAITVVATGFAAAAKFEMTNSGVVDAYVLPQIRGKGVYDNGPLTVESFVAASYGDRPIDLDLPFQADGPKAQDLADYIRSTYALYRVLDLFAVPAARSSTLLTQALSRDIGDVITLSETVTGTTAVQAAIHGVEGSVVDTALTMTWALVPQADTSVFVFDDAVRGVFDDTHARFGYA